jgi:hypothetical protein
MCEMEKTQDNSSNGNYALGGDQFAHDQQCLSNFNATRLWPGLGEPMSASGEALEVDMLRLERAYVEAARVAIQPILTDVPSTPDEFIAWFENLHHSGPGQNDPFFPWLAKHASYEQMRWFLHQEVGGEAGFDDLVALTQIKMPVQAKLEMARNYWDEMGHGQAKGMHGPMLDGLAQYLDIALAPGGAVPESLALGNMMVALATNRRFAFHFAGALGVIEMTAPGRAEIFCRAHGGKHHNRPRPAAQRVA